jgi:AraC-like DNA-binding protein
VQAHCSPGQLIARHRHAAAYAAVVLKGGYEEAGSEGRRIVRAGDVLIYHAYASHLDRIGAKGAELLNIALPQDAVTTDICAGTIADPEALQRVHRTDPRAARAMLLAQIVPASRALQDWPDLLQAQLASSRDLSLAQHARSFGLARETVSRGFSKLYGIAPAAFRLEARARRAWRRVVAEPTPLASIAAEEGFADQAHMTRAVAALTGSPPGVWRRSHSFKTGQSPSA